MSSMELVYRFPNRRQASDVVLPLLDSKDVADVGVVVRQDSVLVGVKVGTPGLYWVRGVLAGGTDVTLEQKEGETFLGWLPPEIIEVYRTKEGVKRFKGYSYRRTR